jgi:rhodanese-related sulfurtransferase
MTKEEFVAEVTDGLLPPPSYFPLNVKLNKEGYGDIAEVIKSGSNSLTPDKFEQMANETGAIMLDVRHQDEFAKSHIPNSIFIGIDGGFAPWVGTLIKDVNHPILLITEDDRLEETITRLSRVGFDNVIGFLYGGIQAWEAVGKDTESIKTVTAEEFYDTNKSDDIKIYDVRKLSEFEAEHVNEAKNTP